MNWLLKILMNLTSLHFALLWFVFNACWPTAFYGNHWMKNGSRKDTAIISLSLDPNWRPTN